MNIETKIRLDRFKPRDYQLPIIDAIENKGYKRVLAILPRRAGKDITAFNLCIRAMLKKVCVIYYILPTYAQGKKILWDSITNSGERILEYLPPELIESSNSQEMKIKLINGSLFQIVGSDNFDCFDDQTEILTLHGWKLFKDVLPTDKVATLIAEPTDGNSVFTFDYSEILRQVEYDYDGELYGVSNSSMDFRVTPNHRFFVYSGKGKGKFKTIEDPTIRHDKIPSRAIWDGSSIEINAGEFFPFYTFGYSSYDFAAFMGIFLAEGSTFSDHKNYRITISQTKPAVREKIKELLKRMGIKFTTLKDGFSFNNKELYMYLAPLGLQHERYIPWEIKNLPVDRLSRMFEWLIMGDGYTCDTYTAYYSTSKRLIDDVQELIIKLGYSGNVSEKKQSISYINGRAISPKRTLYQIRVRYSYFKRLIGSRGKAYIQKYPYKGKVYCVSTLSGIIKVRRNGKEMWSGNSLVGTNPYGCVFSEYALQDPRAYQYIRPILAANNGWCLMISTPRGKNHLWELYNIAQQSPEWFCYRATLDDTQHIPLAEIEKERQEGIMSEDLIQQEYYVSFNLGVEGSYYSKYLERMRLNGQIGTVPWEPSLLVQTAWDIGVRDSTSIIFYQIAGQTIRIIDCYENTKQGLEHYKQVLDSKPYSYGKHFAPHDIGVTEWGTGISRLEKAKQLGIKFEFKMDKQHRAVSALPNLSIMDGIEAVRTTLPKCWIDERNCAQLLKALENYRQEYDHKAKVYSMRPLHNWASHMADAMRYLALSIPKTRDGISREELDRNYQRAVYGADGDLPPFFR